MSVLDIADAVEVGPVGPPADWSDRIGSRASVRRRILDKADLT
jgi:hypothetical protein